jgi:hypothetical protein
MGLKVRIDGGIVCSLGGKVQACERRFLSMQQKVRIDGGIVFSVEAFSTMVDKRFCCAKEAFTGVEKGFRMKWLLPGRETLAFGKSTKGSGV